MSTNLDNAGYNDLSVAQNEYDAICENSQSFDDNLADLIEEKLQDVEAVANVIEQNATVFALAYLEGDDIEASMEVILRHYLAKIAELEV